MPLIYYRILVMKNDQVYDRQLERSDEMSISSYVREMFAHGYGLNITGVEVPAEIASREGQVLWARFFDSPNLGPEIDQAFERGYITNRERLALLRHGVFVLGAPPEKVTDIKNGGMQ